ncbi:SemiSWEET transporter [Candidatus Woesearchaeota archaeon]|nr:SemiSWEET transporter [Candidatus Woesearchaeota archaeon]
MDTISLIGFTAATLTTFSFLPQVVKIWKTKRAQDLSLLTFSIYFVGICLWFTYGLLRKDPVLIFANTIMILLAGSILALKIKYG